MKVHKKLGDSNMKTQTNQVEAVAGKKYRPSPSEIKEYKGIQLKPYQAVEKRGERAIPSLHNGQDPIHEKGEAFIKRG